MSSTGRYIDPQIHKEYNDKTLSCLSLILLVCQSIGGVDLLSAALHDLVKVHPAFRAFPELVNLHPFKLTLE